MLASDMTYTKRVGICYIYIYYSYIITLPIAVSPLRGLLNHALPTSLKRPAAPLALGPRGQQSCRRDQEGVRRGGRSREGQGGSTILEAMLQCGEGRSYLESVIRE